MPCAYLKPVYPIHFLSSQLPSLLVFVLPSSFSSMSLFLLFVVGWWWVDGIGFFEIGKGGVERFFDLDGWGFLRVFGVGG